MRAGPSQDEIRRQNLGALLRHVHVHGATSRAELTTVLGLNRSTIGALTTDLVGAGLVSEGPPKETGRAGRPSLVVRPESERVFAYAFSVEAHRLRAARVGLGGAVLAGRQSPRPPGSTAAETASLLVGMVRDMPTGTPGAFCVGAGVAVVGTVRRGDGRVRSGPTVGWVDEPLGDLLRADLDTGSITVGSLADLAGWAEHVRGVAVDCADVVYLHGDAGIGAGIVAGGRRLTGHGGYGGEVGHMVVNPGGRPCECGSRGCWQTEVGGPALLRTAGREAGQDPVLAVIDPATRGDARAQAAVRQAGDWLGFGVANLVNVLNPEMVVFGGTMRDLYLAAAAQVRSRLNAMALAAGREHLRLRTPQLGDDAPLVGAAELAFERLLADPLDV